MIQRSAPEIPMSMTRRFLARAPVDTGKVSEKSVRFTQQHDLEKISYGTSASNNFGCLYCHEPTVWVKLNASPEYTRRKTFAPSSRPRAYMRDRDVVILNENLPVPPKKHRQEMYHEERNQFSKPVFKTPEPRSVNTTKVIEKKPQLISAAVNETDEDIAEQRRPEPSTSGQQDRPDNEPPRKKVRRAGCKRNRGTRIGQERLPRYRRETKPAATHTECQALPQRTTVPRRKVPPNPEPKKPDAPATPKPVVKAEIQKPKEVPAVNKDKTVKEVPAVNKNKVVNEVPEVKEVSAVKEAKVVKEVPSVKVANVVKEPLPVSTAPAEKQVDKNKNAGVAKPTPTVKPNEDGIYELDPNIADILQDELAQIMIKVWQELPDSPPTEAEELVVDRFRNAAGDDLQNALGLSVTARLLNIHNPLYAKLQFSCKPEAGCLQAFIREYNISAFKRIADKVRDTFAARFEGIKDFDKLCAHSEVRCGSATVSIIPCHKYLSCPPSIKTIYAVNSNKTKTAAKQSSAYSTALKSDMTRKSAQKVVKAIDKENKTDTKSNTNKTVPPVKNTVANTTKVNEQEKTKPGEPSEPTKVAETSKVTTKIGENKTEDNNKSCDKSKEGSDEMMVVDEMGEGDEEDDEEMTDQDILALMSGGIVLDECSGSEDES